MKLKQLVYAFLILFSIIFVFVNQKYCKRISVVNGYVENFSVNRGDDIIAYLQPTEEHKKGVVLIYNLKGKIVDSLVCNLQFQDTTTSAKFYETGYTYQCSVVYNTSKLKSGIYYFNNLIPFIVKEPKLKNALTIVFPYANMHALNNVGGKSFYGYSSTNSEPATKLSLHRNLVITDYTLSFLNWIDSLYSKNNLNIITDLDLENYSNISNSKLLVLYGNSAFWTYKARHNFDRFQFKKGNVLAIASSLMNNKFRYEKSSHSLIFIPESKNDSCKNLVDKTGQWDELIFNNPNYNSVGCSYEITNEEIASKQSFGGFKIIDENHPIFKNIAEKTIEFKSSIYNSLKVLNESENHNLIADKTFGNFSSKEILAYDYGTYNGSATLGGIFLMQKTITSGKLLLITSTDWCDIDNFKKQKLQLVNKNCIKYLMAF